MSTAILCLNIGSLCLWRHEREWNAWHFKSWVSLSLLFIGTERTNVATFREAQISHPKKYFRCVQFILKEPLSAVTDDRFYISLFSALEQTFVACDSKWVTVAFYCTFWIPTEVVYVQRCLDVTRLVPRETAVVCVLYNMHHTTCAVSRHFMRSHIHRVHACLVLTCHLHYWQVTNHTKPARKQLSSLS